jgi:hypothetical protein
MMMATSALAIHVSVENMGGLIMPIENWEKPIEISSGKRESVVVTGPFDAVICLSDGWPEMRSASFIAARTACRAALAGRATAEEARRCFLAAVEEAKLTQH